MILKKFLLFFRHLFQKDQRSLYCLAVSLFAHILLIVFLCILILPQKGQEGTDIVEVSFASEGMKENKDTQESFVPEAKEEKFSKEDVSQEKLEEMKEILKLEDSQEAKEYIEKQHQKLEQKKKSIESYSQQQGKIEKSIQQRSRYGTLTPRTFYGIAIFSKSMVFILDVSGSMDVEEAKRQLKNAYHALKNDESFNVIVYSDSIQSWQPGLMYANNENKQKADMWLQDIKSGGATNIYSALQKAFDVAYQKTKAETIYFLSDGLPTSGPEQDPVRILAAVKKWNQDKKITIHTIGLGPHQDEFFLSRLAQDNQGKYYVR